MTNHYIVESKAKPIAAELPAFVAQEITNVIKCTLLDTFNPIGDVRQSWLIQDLLSDCSTEVLSSMRYGWDQCEQSTKSFFQLLANSLKMDNSVSDVFKN